MSMPIRRRIAVAVAVPLLPLGLAGLAACSTGGKSLSGAAFGAGAGSRAYGSAGGSAPLVSGGGDAQTQTQDPAFLTAVGNISTWQSAHCALGSQ
jgi:hypothetical protein